MEQQWEVASLQAREDPEGELLVLDEVQKVSGWSEVVKHLCDQDTEMRDAFSISLEAFLTMDPQQWLAA